METYEELRPYLFAIAYRMLGSVASAEDVVQQAFLRHHAADTDAESPKAYLATVTHAARDRRAPLGPRAPRGVPGSVVAGAARRGRRGPTR